jgi:hypothetical protein
MKKIGSRKYTKRKYKDKVVQTASNLDIQWPDDICWDSPTHAHWFTAYTNSTPDTIFVCKYCHVAKWLPTRWRDAERFGLDIATYGIDSAYHIWLNKRPAVRAMLKKLEDLRLLQRVVSVDDYLMVVAAIMSDKDYSNEEDSK